MELIIKVRLDEQFDAGKNPAIDIAREIVDVVRVDNPMDDYKGEVMDAEWVMT